MDSAAYRKALVARLDTLRGQRAALTTLAAEIEDEIRICDAQIKAIDVLHPPAEPDDDNELVLSRYVLSKNPEKVMRALWDLNGECGLTQLQAKLVDGHGAYWSGARGRSRLRRYVQARGRMVELDGETVRFRRGARTVLRRMKPNWAR